MGKSKKEPKSTEAIKFPLFFDVFRKKRAHTHTNKYHFGVLQKKDSISTKTNRVTLVLLMLREKGEGARAMVVRNVLV